MMDQQIEDRLTPMNDPRPFREVITEWLAAQPRPAYKTAPLLRVSAASLTRWRAGYPCYGETAVRALMTLIDELKGEDAISQLLGEGMPFRVILRAWLDYHGFSISEGARRMDVPQPTVSRWLSRQDCHMERAMRAQMYMIDEGRA